MRFGKTDYDADGFYDELVEGDGQPRATTSTAPGRSISCRAQCPASTQAARQ